MARSNFARTGIESVEVHDFASGTIRRRSLIGDFLEIPRLARVAFEASWPPVVRRRPPERQAYLSHHGIQVEQPGVEGQVVEVLVVQAPPVRGPEIALSIVVFGHQTLLCCGGSQPLTV